MGKCKLYSGEHLCWSNRTPISHMTVLLSIGPLLPRSMNSLESGNSLLLSGGFGKFCVVEDAPSD